MRWLVAAALFGALSQPVPAQPALNKIQVAVVDKAPSVFCALSYVRQPVLDRFAKSENIEFEPVLVESSILPTVVSKGDLPIGECSGLSAIFSAWLKGARNLTVFSVGAIKPIYQIVAAKSIHELAALRGKSLGTPGLQTASTEAIQVILKRGAGLLYPGDYDLISTGTGSARVAALLSRRIDALPTFPPYGYDLVERGYNMLGDEADFVPQYVTGPYVVNHEWASKNPDLMRRVVRVVVKTG
ncbi:MAG TPA: ABC transporter substrate-binding protein, partial [Beijerinckiaceae bacterium]|nr:ABC transporter substrate-binding protein [Beijerinckiaceae bacterium]